MKCILLKEDDSSLFEQPFEPQYYGYFQHNKEDIISMVNDQTEGFWLRYIISLRSVMVKRGYVPKMDLRAVFAEDTFINMTHLMVEKTYSKRRDKIFELIEDLRTFYKYNYLAGEAGMPAPLVWSHPEYKPALDRIFGSAEDLPRKFIMFTMWTRFAAGLVECHKHWRKAMEVSSLAEIPWKAPAQWYYPGRIYRAFLFENALKKNWGVALRELVGFEPSTIAWWDGIEKTIAMRLGILTSDYPHMVWSNGVIELEPIFSDDEDDGTKATSTASVSSTPGGRKKCSNCNIPEPVKGTYKRCKKCLDKGFPDPKYYCSRNCQTEDWETVHKSEHRRKSKMSM